MNVKKVLLPFLLMVSVMWCSAFAFKQNRIQKIINSMVMVTYTDTDGAEFVCSGFIVKAPIPKTNAVEWPRAITARHCVLDLDVVQVDGEDSIVLKRDDSFALLSVPSPISGINKVPLEIETKPLEYNQRVLSFGFGYGVMEVLERSVSAWKGEAMAVDGPFIKGMSGGPLVNQDGKVVGLIQASDNIIGIASRQEEIKAFLEQP